MRSLLALMLLVLSPLACAENPVAADQGRQFIDRSVVSFPEEHAGHRLREAHYDPAQWENGVSLDYALAQAPAALQFNIYVYPKGRSPAADALSAAMNEVEQAIRHFEKSGEYAGVQFGDITSFSVPAPIGSRLGDPHKAPPGSDFDSELIRLTTVSPTLDGRRRLLSLTRKAVPARSLAYVFYSQLFLIKVRASVPVAAMDAEDFNARVDAAVTRLVPQMRVDNYGACGTIQLALAADTGDKDRDTQANALELAREMARVQRENCANTGPDREPVAGREREILVYPDGTWN